MNFPELCARLIREVGEANVLSPDYPGLGSKETGQEEWVLRIRNGRYDVGAIERGRWVSTQVFDTEDEACEYLYSLLTKPVRIRLETREEREESERITSAYFQKLLEGPTRPED